MESDRLDSRAKGSIVAGSLIMLAFFVGLGGWAAVAPLSSAVLAPAVVKVEGNRKAVQHLEGGIVREIRVKEGDRVQAGQVLSVLDDVQARGSVNLLTKQHVELSAQEARLLAEQAQANEVVFPAELVKSDDPDVRRILAAHEALFRTRRATLVGQAEILGQKIAQAREQIVGSEGQLAAQRRQLESIRAELSGLQDLFARGYVPRQRILELQRSALAFEGQATQTEANIVTLRQSVQELELQVAQLHADRIAEVAHELQEVQVKLLDIGPRLQVAREALKRTLVRSPAAGVVVGLSVFTEGGVIAAGERLMEIVPDHGDVSVEATIAVDDQKDVYAGMPAEVHLTAYKQRSAPVVKARVTHVSPDRLTDERTGAGYYLGRVDIAREDLAKLKDVRLIPGMPALVIIPTGERTVLDYLLRPLTDSFVRSLREK